MRNQYFTPALKYNWATPFYDFFIKLTMPESQVKSKVIELVEIKATDKVLDFGFGTGTSIVMLAKMCPKAQIYGFDVDEKIISIAQKKFEKNNLKIGIFRNDLNVIHSKSMDKIISSWVFHHLDIQQKRHSFHELFRILKPGGVIVIADWGRPKNLLMKILFFILQIADNFDTLEDNKKGKITELLIESGFVNIQNREFRNTLFGTLWYWKAFKIES